MPTRSSAERSVRATQSLGDEIDVGRYTEFKEDESVDSIGEHQSQYPLRSWIRIYDELPALAGQRVLDLGCGPGLQAREIAARGASVTGVDFNPDLVEHAARQSGASGCTFVVADATELSGMQLGRFDGIWSSFAVAYSVELEPVLRMWADHLEPGGWMAITEMSGLFDHEPMPRWARERLQAFYRARFEAGIYDFLSGSKLEEALVCAGLRIAKHQLVADAELADDGPVSAAAMASWQRRFGRMKGLAEFFGNEFEDFRGAFLRAIASDRHVSRCEVHFVLAYA